MRKSRKHYLSYLARRLELYPGTRCEYGREVVMPFGAAHFLPTHRHRLFLTWPWFTMVHFLRCGMAGRRIYRPLWRTCTRVTGASDRVGHGQWGRGSGELDKWTLPCPVMTTSWSVLTSPTSPPPSVLQLTETQSHTTPEQNMKS